MKEKKSISLIIIVLTMALFCSYHIYYHFIDIANDSLVRNYNQKIDEKKEKTLVEKINNEEYLGILTIPKINLKAGFYHINSSKNNVNNSVSILKESIMPNSNNSIIYLAAHSGTGYLAYFKNIDMLTDNDIMIITYNGSDYYYVVNNIYEMPKNGEIVIKRNVNEKYLVLTTCSKNDNMQLIITAKMINRL